MISSFNRENRDHFAQRGAILPKSVHRGIYLGGVYQEVYIGEVIP